MNGPQEMLLGDGGRSNGGVRTLPLPIRSNRPCTTDGRMRNTYERRFSARGAVNVVPDTSSLTSP